MFDFLPPIVLQAILIAVPAIGAYLYVKRVRSAQYLQRQKQNSDIPTGDQSGGKDK